MSQHKFHLTLVSLSVSMSYCWSTSSYMMLQSGGRVDTLVGGGEEGQLMPVQGEHVLLSSTVKQHVMFAGEEAMPIMILLHRDSDQNVKLMADSDWDFTGQNACAGARRGKV